MPFLGLALSSTLFVIMDRWVGKRALNKLVDTLILESTWLQKFYRLRIVAEEIGVDSCTRFSLLK